MPKKKAKAAEKPKLPNKPSALIRVAVKDLTAAENTKGYVLIWGHGMGHRLKIATYARYALAEV